MNFFTRFQLLSCVISMMAAPSVLIAENPILSWDSQSLIVNGKRVIPVMGEIHYSRVPRSEWADAVRKMKDGGVTIIATYVFWNHIESTEGVYDWSGQRDLRHFLEVCAREEMPVVLRVGPFCHGEARCGGIPDWVFEKGIKTRAENPDFMALAERLYRQIFTQVQGLQWKDGGPVMACQFDNEYRGHGSYLMALKGIAGAIGFDLPLYTRTGWPELKTPVPYGEMLPLYGDYADGFWERSLKPAAGNYYKAFNFKSFRSSTAIASEQLKDQRESVTRGDEQYPYFTCELGGGMMCSYHRRPWIYPEDAYALAVVKLGSGSNLLGYYMYHGGTNPDSSIPLNEVQNSAATNYNDMPEKTYDFQAPLGEFGQPNPHYYTLRKLHLFMHDFGESLAPMEASFPVPQDLPKGDDRELRWCYRSLGDSAFVFVNNYERLQNLSDKKGVRFDVGGVKFPSRKISIPSGTTCIFPVNIAGLRYATAQLIARRDGKIFMEQIDGVPTEIAVDGKVLKNVKALGPDIPVYGNIYLLTSTQASRLFLDPETDGDDMTVEADVRKIKEADGARHITIGVNKVAEAPVDVDFERAAVYEITGLPDADSRQGKLLMINYRGDVARLYCDGKLVADNFYNGRPMLMGLWRLPADAGKLELRILPLQEDMPVYFPEEADTTPGEQVDKISITVINNL
ncbi:MAG: beta-galactosidase [Clostridiales bacterium]|nr:beta-galactosidase [Clostridiales bacterium]